MPDMTTPSTPSHQPSCHLRQPHSDTSTCLSEMAHGCTCQPPIPSLEQEAEALSKQLWELNRGNLMPYEFKEAHARRIKLLVNFATRQREETANDVTNKYVLLVEEIHRQERHATAWRCIDLITHHVNGRGSLREQFTESIRAEFGLTE